MAGLRKRARSIRLAIFDVDGVLTDGTVWMGPAGEAIKAFNILDGHGIKMIQQAGVATAILAGRKSRAVSLRAKELGIGDVIQGSTDKLADFASLAAKHGVTPEECAFVGDDLPDLPVMDRVGLAVAVANAVEPVKKRAHYITRASGGHGAVREFCDMLVAARSKDGE